MNFSQLFIRRPALTIVISLVMTIVGLISYTHLAVRWLPSINPPIVSIQTDYPGASANLIETQVTTPLEAALSGVEGVGTIASHSKEGESYITITFKLGHNINASVEDVRSALQRANGMLPTDAKQPVVEKMDPDSQPTLYLAFADPNRSAKEVTDYVKQFILPRFESIDGVASILMFGERESALRIWLDPLKMAAANVSVEDLTNVLTQQNVEVPSGQIRGVSRYYPIVTNETVKSVNEFNDLIIRDDDNKIIRLKDVGNAVVDAANTDSAFRVRGQSAVALAIVPQATANPLDVSRDVLKEFKQIQKTLPRGMQGSVVFNQADFIHASVSHVYQSLVEAIILVLIVIFLFLANWRAAFIPIATIPVCLISVFTVLFILKFSINTITLMALVLAIGLVVDDAIVMLENITRHIESGMPPMTAALKGSREMLFPIIAMTLTLAAVYAPIAFTGGILGSVFSEFAVTLAGTVLISGFIALTLTPMMCSRWLSPIDKVTHYGKSISSYFQALQVFYQKMLRKTLTKKRAMLIVLIGTGLAGCLIYRALPAELVPAEDMNEIDVYVSAPRDSSAHYTDAYVQQLEKIYEKIPEMQSYLSDIGSWSPSRSYQFISLQPREKRKRSVEEIASDLTAQVKSISGVRVSVNPPPSPLSWFSGSNGATVAMQVMSSGDYKSLHMTMQQLIAAAQKTGVFSSGIDSSLKWDGSQFEVSIDREKAADMKVPMQTITNTISILIAGRNIGHFEYDGNQYDVKVQMNMVALANPNIISELYVRNTNNKMVPLAGLITLHETTSPEMLPHFERLRADTLYATLAPGYTIADAVTVLQKIARDILPDNARYTFVGEAQNYLESSSTMGFAFFLALVFIYLILVAQFESFIDPFIILLTVPFAVIGALLALKIAGGSLNIYSDIGLVTLIGLITKHGILITEFANKERERGKSIEEAVIEAAKLRLRPILMTTAAMILGALPLAFATGPGAENRHQIGWVVVGGLLLGTFFSLVVVPMAYSYFAKFKRVSSLAQMEKNTDAKFSL